MKIKIELTYKVPKGPLASFVSSELEPDQALQLANDLEKTGRAKDMKLIDSHDHSWTVKDLKKWVKGIQSEPHNIRIYFDGGFDLETRSAGLGFAIYYNQGEGSYRIRKNALIEELASNNEAEYAALHLAIQEVELLGVQHLPIVIKGDSKVVINQITGEWPCYDEALNNWADRIEHKLEELKLTPNFQVISRKDNREADRLATQAREGTVVSSTMELES